MYAALQQAGFRDVWAEHGTGAGFTCCHDPDLWAGALAKRIDYVLTRGGFDTGPGDLVGGTRISVLDPALASGGPAWPSDHAALLVKLPPAR